MVKTALRKVGNSLGVTLPKGVLASYDLGEGDELYLVETQDGLLLTPYDPKYRAWVKAYENSNQRYRNTLRELAK
jgi:putative addiction module antidote